MSRASRSQTLPRERTTLIDERALGPNVRIMEPAQTPTGIKNKNNTYQPHKQHHQKNRPVSLYDNMRGNISGSGTISSASGALSVGNLASIPNNNGNNTPAFLSSTFNSGCPRLMDRSPSQANCLSTTVPQNIAGTTFAGRHTPTRNSLRHSRMIVQNRRKVSKKYHPRVMRHHKLAMALVALQTLMGVAVTLLSGWLLVWAPHLRTRDIPYWTGIPLLASGIVGLMLLCCCRKDYPGQSGGFVGFFLKVVSVFLASTASVTCFCASVFALLHLIVLRSMSCEPAHVLNASCVCQSSANATEALRSFHYIDLNCPEVTSILSVLLIGSCAANAIAGVFTAWYVLLHWHSRYTNLYSEVRTNENNPIVIGNKVDPKVLNSN